MLDREPRDFARQQVTGAIECPVTAHGSGVESFGLPPLDMAGFFPAEDGQNP